MRMFYIHVLHVPVMPLIYPHMMLHSCIKAFFFSFSCRVLVLYMYMYINMYRGSSQNRKGTVCLP